MRKFLPALMTVALIAPMAAAQSQSPDAQIKSLRHELSELRVQLQAIQKQLAELKSQNKQQTERLETEGKTEKMKQWLKARSRVRSERNALTQQKLQVKRTEEGLKRTVATESKKMEAKQAAADKAAEAEKKAPVHAAPKRVSHRQRNRVRTYPYPYYQTNGLFHGRVIYGPHGYYPYLIRRPHHKHHRHHRHHGSAGTVRYQNDKWSIKFRF